VRERVVHHDQATAADPRHQLGPVRGVGEFVRVDERDVERLFRGERAERAERRPELELDPVAQPGLLPVLAGDRRPLLADVAGQQVAAGAERAGDADGRIAGKGPYLDAAPGPAEPGEQRQQRPHLRGHLQGDLVRIALRRLGGQLPEDRVRRGAVCRQVRVEVEADLLAAPRHPTNLVQPSPAGRAGDGPGRHTGTGNPGTDYNSLSTPLHSPDISSLIALK
jgi:hypothetical protein